MIGSLPESPILSFYRMTGPNAAGRSLADIMAFDNEQLESVHNYIQWLFPLPEESGANPRAPILKASDIAAFRGDPALQAKLLKSLAMMLEFYGFSLKEDGSQPVVRVSSLFAHRRVMWLRPNNHNLLRITRILRSLTLLGLGTHAGAFLACLERLSGLYDATIGERTMAFWREAVTGGDLSLDP